jgi:DNA polymerase-3 subunit alpha
MSTKDKVPFFVARCEEMGIEILPPDVNLSDHEFTVEATPAAGRSARTGASAASGLPNGPGSAGGVGNVRFGLDAVKGVGYQAVEAIIRAREQDGRFGSLWNFCERVDSRAVNKKAIEALIKSGALGSTAATRKGMLSVLESAQAAGQKAQQDALIGQGSIFDLCSEDSSGAGAGGASAGAGDGGAGAAGGSGPASGSALLRPSHPPIPAEEFDHAQLLAIEKEAIGLFISDHPLKPLREALRARADCPLAALAGKRDKDWVTVGGIITECKRIRTRNGDHMMFATLDDLEGSVEMLVFGKALAEHQDTLAVDQVVLVRGRVDHKEADKTCVVVQSVERFDPTDEEIRRAQGRAEQQARVQAQNAQPLHLHVNVAHLQANAIEDLKHVLESYRGHAEVVLELLTSAGKRVPLRLGEAYRVQHTPLVRAELEAVLAPALAATA